MQAAAAAAGHMEDLLTVLGFAAESLQLVWMMLSLRIHGGMQTRNLWRVHNLTS
jgi:hypothetical protein